MKSLLRLLPVALPFVALCGCANLMVPKTTLDIPLPNGQTAHYSGPKNTSVDEVSVTVSPGGVTQLTIKKAQTTMDPNVISMSSQAFNSGLQTAANAGLQAAQIAFMMRGWTNAFPLTNLPPLPPGQ